MATHRRVLAKLLQGSYDVGFREFMSLLEAFGFRLDRVKGSHHVFLHPEVTELLSVQPRRDGKAKPYQLRQFLKLVEAYDLELTDG